MSGLDKAFGVSPQVLALRTQKLNLLSANIANASTPDYKARDIDFRAAMSTALNESSQLKRTHEQHFDINGATSGAPVKYRVPSQASVDGNTVGDASRAHRLHGERGALSGQRELPRQQDPGVAHCHQG